MHTNQIKIKNTFNKIKQKVIFMILLVIRKCIKVNYTTKQTETKNNQSLLFPQLEKNRVKNRINKSKHNINFDKI